MPDQLQDDQESDAVVAQRADRGWLGTVAIVILIVALLAAIWWLGIGPAATRPVDGNLSSPASSAAGPAWTPGVRDHGSDRPEWGTVGSSNGGEA